MPNHVNAPTGTEQTKIKLIFVVDDDKEIGTLIVHVIEQETPHHAHHHTSGSQVLQATTNYTPQLFILDYSLPDMNGLELHDRLHTFDRLKNIPTLLISAQKPPLREIRQRQITYLAKPFELDKLLHAVGTLLGESLS